MTLTEEAAASLWVPHIPQPRERRVEPQATRWNTWLRSVGAFGLANRVPLFDVPVRCRAEVRIADPRLQGDYGQPMLDRWRQGMVDALLRSGWVAAGCLTSVTVEYVAVEGVAPLDMPRKTGTMISIYLEDGDETARIERP